MKSARAKDTRRSGACVYSKWPLNSISFVKPSHHCTELGGRPQEAEAIEQTVKRAEEPLRKNEFSSPTAEECDFPYITITSIFDRSRNMAGLFPKYPLLMTAFCTIPLWVFSKTALRNEQIKINWCSSSCWGLCVSIHRKLQSRRKS